MIQTLKKSLGKTFASDQDPYLALLTLRTTPDEDGISPAYRLMNRQLRTVIPSLSLQQQNQSNYPVQISQKATDRYNSTASHLPELHLGDTVRLRKNKRWERKGRVISTSEKPRFYHVETENGKRLRRNRRHLLKTSETFSAKSPSDFEIPNTPSSTPVTETPTDYFTTPQLTPDTPVSIREELPTMNDADKSQGISTSTAQAVLSSHHQNTRTLLITKVLQDLVICMETETVYLIIHRFLQGRIANNE